MNIYIYMYIYIIGISDTFLHSKLTFFFRTLTTFPPSDSPSEAIHRMFMVPSALAPPAVVGPVHPKRDVNVGL